MKTAGQEPSRLSQKSLGAGPLFRSRRQRNRLIRQSMEISDHVGALAVLRDAGKAHRGSGDKALGAGDELVEVIVGPLASLGLHACGIIETRLAGAITAHDAVEVRADLVGTALAEVVTGAALLRRSG